MTSTNSSQHGYNAELEFIGFMVTRPADPTNYTKENLIQVADPADHTEGSPIQDDNKNKYLKYRALYRAATKGDWEETIEFFEENPDAVTASINLYEENALHIAVQAGDKAIDFVKNLVRKMTPEALECKTIYGQTALIFAAYVGNMRAADILVQKHPQLLYIPDIFEFLPVHMAVRCGQKDTIQYFLSATQRYSHEQGDVRPFTDESGHLLVAQVIFREYCDEALRLIHWYPELAKGQLDNGYSVLSAIVSKVSAFRSGSHLYFWENAVYSCAPVKLDKHAIERSRSDIEDPKHNLAQTFVQSFYIPVSQRLKAMLYKILALVPYIKHIGDKRQMHYQAVQLVKLCCEQIATLNDYQTYESIVKGALLSAEKLGVKEAVEEILDLFPDAILFSNDESHSVFQLAILHRQKKVFNIIYQIDACKQMLVQRIVHIDKKRNTMLHLAGRLAHQSTLNHIPGAALQMQSELQWYKEVENLMPPELGLQKNEKGEISAMLFTEEHKGLVCEGEKWMKDAANSCTIVASLIATIAFAAAITVPGGNDNSGLPNFSKESAFIIFTISNALYLFTAITSLLMFLSIFTSRYGESDFLYVLPKRLIIGLVTLFLSITTMMVSFTATLYLVTGKYKEKILIPVVAVAIVPIYIFMSLQFPLLLDLINLTYDTSF